MRRAERAQLACAACAARRSAGTGARGAAGAGGRASPRASRSQSPRARPSVSSAPCATLKTASSIGTSRGQRRARGARAHGLLGHDRERLEARRRVEARGAARRAADHEAAVQRRRDVVGMALQLAREREQVGVELEHVIGRHQARDDRRRARAEAARERDLRADPEGEAVGRVQPLEGAHAEVLAPCARPAGRSRRRTRPSPRPRARACSDERRRHAVEARAQVRRGRRHAHDAATDASTARLASPTDASASGRCRLGITQHRFLDRVRSRRRTG